MKIGKIGILVTNLHDKDKHVIHIRNLKQALNHGLVVLKKIAVIKFDQEVWLKSYINMNTELKKMQRL